jgi:hypothetical protein
MFISPLRDIIGVWRSVYKQNNYTRRATMKTIGTLGGDWQPVNRTVDLKAGL